jgi:hypothetical protein
MRETFDATGRIVSPSELDLHLVELSGALSVIDLRHDRTLDVLRLDDQINTSRSPGVWRACHQLTDLVQDWFGERCHGIVYRPRTSPQRGASLVFFEHTPLVATDLGRLGDNEGLLAACVLSDGFTVMGWR